MIWPSATKLARLRGAGVVPISTVSLRIAVLLMTGIVLMNRWPRLAEQLSYKKLLLPSENLWLLSASVASELAQTLLFIAGALIFTLFVLGLLQGRFLFLPGLATFHFSRIWSFSRVRAIFSSSLRMGVLLVAVLLLLAMLCMKYVPLLASRLNLSKEELLHTDWQSLWSPLLVSGLLGLALLLAVACNRFLFLWIHRMSREEVERETRG